jgi:hypothetical protein
VKAAPIAAASMALQDMQTEPLPEGQGMVLKVFTDRTETVRNHKKATFTYQNSGSITWLIMAPHLEGIDSIDRLDSIDVK